jgi:hypothetical protein
MSSLITDDDIDDDKDDKLSMPPPPARKRVRTKKTATPQEEPKPAGRRYKLRKRAHPITIVPANAIDGTRRPKEKKIADYYEPVDFESPDYKQNEWASKYEHGSTIIGLALRDFDCMFINATTDRDFYLEVLLPQLEVCKARADRYKIREEKPTRKQKSSIAPRCSHIQYSGPMVVENKIVSELVYTDLDDLVPEAKSGLLVIYFNPDSDCAVERSRSSLIKKTETAVIYQMDRRTLVELGQHSITSAYAVGVRLPWSLERFLVIAQFGATIPFSFDSKMDGREQRLRSIRRFFLSPEVLSVYGGVLRYERQRLFVFAKHKPTAAERQQAEERQTRDDIESDPFYEIMKKMYEDGEDELRDDDDPDGAPQSQDLLFWRTKVETDDMRSEATSVNSASSRTDPNDNSDNVSGISSFVLSEQEGRNSFTMRVDQHEFSDCLFEPVETSSSHDTLGALIPVSQELSRDPSRRLIERMNLILATGMVLVENYYDSRLDRWESVDFCYLFALVERRQSDEVIRRWVASLRKNNRALLGFSQESVIGLVDAVYELAAAQENWVRDLFIENVNTPECPFLHSVIDTFQVANTVEKRRASVSLIRTKRATKTDVEEYCREFQLYSLAHRFKFGQKKDCNLADVILEFDSKQATPLAIASSIKNAAPKSRQGIDFLVVHTVLAYLAIRAEPEPASRRRLYVCMNKATWRIICLGVVPRTITQLRTSSKQPMSLQHCGHMAPIINAALSDPNSAIVAHALTTVQMLSFSSTDATSFEWRQESHAAQQYAKKAADTLSVYAQSMSQMERPSDTVWKNQPYESPAERTKRLSLAGDEDRAEVFSLERSNIVANIASGIMSFMVDRVPKERYQRSNINSIFAGLQLVLSGNSASFVMHRDDLQATIANSPLKEEFKVFLRSRLGQSGTIAEVIMRRTRLSQEHADKLALDPSSVLECVCGASTQVCNRMRLLLPKKLSSRLWGGLEKETLECCICNKYSKKALARIQSVGGVMLGRRDRNGTADWYKTCDACIKRGATLQLRNIDPGFILLFNNRSPKEAGYSALQFVEQFALCNDLASLGRIRLCIGTNILGISVPKNHFNTRAHYRHDIRKLTNNSAAKVQTAAELIEVARAKSAESPPGSKKRSIVIPAPEKIDYDAQDLTTADTPVPAPPPTNANTQTVEERAKEVFNRRQGNLSVATATKQATEKFLAGVQGTSVYSAISSPTRQRLELLLALESLTMHEHGKVAETYQATFKPTTPETPQQVQNRLISHGNLLAMLSPMTEECHVKAANSFAVAEHFLETSALFPLCSSALVESMPYGAHSLRGHASESLLKVFDTAARVLSSGRVPRPFAESAPEILTTLFLNWFDPSDDMTVPPRPAPQQTTAQTN